MPEPGGRRHPDRLSFTPKVVRRGGISCVDRVHAGVRKIGSHGLNVLLAETRIAFKLNQVLEICFGKPQNDEHSQKRKSKQSWS